MANATNTPRPRDPRDDYQKTAADKAKEARMTSEKLAREANMGKPDVAKAGYNAATQAFREATGATLNPQEKTAALEPMAELTEADMTRIPPAKMEDADKKDMELIQKAIIRYVKSPISVVQMQKSIKNWIEADPETMKMVDRSALASIKAEIGSSPDIYWTRSCLSLRKYLQEMADQGKKFKHNMTVDQVMAEILSDIYEHIFGNEPALASMQRQPAETEAETMEDDGEERKVA